VKSRPEQSRFTPQLDKIGKGILSKFTSGKKGEEEEMEPNEQVDKRSWFSRLGKKTKTYMHQLLKTSEDETKGIAPMKWDHFLKVKILYLSDLDSPL